MSEPRFKVTSAFVSDGDTQKLAESLNKEALDGYKLVAVVVHNGMSTAWTTFIWERV